MNQTNLTNSTYSTWPITRWQSYSRGVACCFAILTNTINICVLQSPKLKYTSFKYMLVNSITNLIYAITSFISIFLVRCPNCPAAQTYEAAIYAIIIFFYLENCLQLFKATIELTLSFHTFCILKNKKWFLNISYKPIIAILLFFSMIIYIEEIFSYGITQSAQSNDTVVYSARLNTFGKSDIGRALSITSNSIQIFLAVIVLRIINFINIAIFRLRYKSRKIGNATNKFLNTVNTIQSLGTVFN